MPKTIKNGAYIINHDEYADVGTHWTALCVKNNEAVYFDSFGVEHVPKESKIYWTYKHQNKHIQSTSRQFDNVWYFCIAFCDFMFAGRSLIDFTSLFSPYDFKKNDKIIFVYLNKVLKKEKIVYNLHNRWF